MTTLMTEIIQNGGWVFRLRRGNPNANLPLILMLHGWTGDENSMGVFAGKMPSQAWLLSPRAPFHSKEGGYSWLPENGSLAADIDMYLYAMNRLLGAIDRLQIPDSLRKLEMDLIGFSQGAAMCYAISLTRPQRIRKIAGLAGFLPKISDGLIANRPLQDKQIFIAHGTEDDRVPVEMARQASTILSQAGADIIYCESPVGHKLSADCFHGLSEFFQSAPTHDRDQS